MESVLDSLLDKQRLRQKVVEMDEVDRAKNHVAFTEEICHCIYNDYAILKQDLEVVKKDIWDILGFQGGHLHTSRMITVFQIDFHFHLTCEIFYRKRASHCRVPKKLS